MWPFSKRQTRADSVPTLVPTPSLPTDLGVFCRNDAVIKVWLTDNLAQGLDALSAMTGMSRPDVLRWLLFEHVYGRLALERLNEWERGRARDRTRRTLRTDTPDIRASVQRPELSERSLTVQILGKSIEDVKLWLPSPLKSQLANLADLESLGLSDYVRKTLVRILLGEAVHHQWRAAVGKLPEEIKRFETEPES